MAQPANGDRRDAKNAESAESAEIFLFKSTMHLFPF